MKGTEVRGRGGGERGEVKEVGGNGKVLLLVNGGKGLKGEGGGKVGRKGRREG